MPSSESDAIYEMLLKRYKENGFLTPRSALDSNIRSLMLKGKTRDEAIRELNSSDSPWTYSPATPSIVSQQERETEQNIAVLGQIANLREKIDSLTTLFSNGEITEETYRRGVKRVEESIDRLQREHKILQTEKQEHTPTSIFRNGRRKTVEELDETSHRHSHSPVDPAWWFVPFFFGFFGGIIAYVAVKDKNQEMADKLFIFSILWSTFLFFLWWFLILH